MRAWLSLALLLSVTLPATPAAAQIEVLDRSGGPGRVQAPGGEANGPASLRGEAEPSEPVPCGTADFTIADMGWPSAAILAQIHASILQVEFGCTVRLVPGEPEGTLSSMATTRQPAVAPELWVSRQAEVWNGAMRASSARAAAPSFSGGPLEAWFVPRYIKEAHPGLGTVGDLADHWQVFAEPGRDRGQLLSCPDEWACSIINQSMVAARGLDARFEIAEPLDRFDMDARISTAVAQSRPILTYYWQPNALIDRLDLVPLDMGEIDPTSIQCMGIRDCVPFEPSGFAPDTVVIALAEWVFTQAPDVADYFARASMPIDEMNRLLAWQAEQDASPEAVAQHFLITGRDIWHQWVDAAETGPDTESDPDVE